MQKKRRKRKKALKMALRKIAKESARAGLIFAACIVYARMLIEQIQTADGQVWCILTAVVLMAFTMTFSLYSNDEDDEMEED